MRLDVQRAMTRSARYFRDQAWPTVAERLGGGQLIPVETVTDSAMASLLDTAAGVDAWQLTSANGIRALATRVQFGGTCWGTWTVRYQLASGNRTEYDKLIDPDRSLLRPSYHVQAYTSQDEAQLLGVGYIRSDDLARLLLAGAYDTRTNPADGNQFVAVAWGSAAAQGCDSWEWWP